MVHRLAAIVALLGTFGSIACAPTATVSQPKPASPPKPQAVAVVTGAPDAPDEAKFKQRFGQARRIKLDEAQATILSRLSTPKATYLRLQAPPGVELKTSLLQSMLDGSGRPLAAALWTPSAGSSLMQSASNYEILIRLPAGAHNDSISSLTWTARRIAGADTVAGGYEQTLKVPPIDNAPADTNLERRFGEALSAWFRQRSDAGPFMSFAAGRIVHRLVKPSAKEVTRDSLGRQRTELSELMDFYTGRSSVRDSLQTDRGLLLSRKPSARTIDPATLDANSSVDRDYEKLVEKSLPNTNAVVSPLAEALPADTLVVEFATLKDMIQLPRILDTQLGTILRIAESSGGSNHLMERYRTQLGIELDGFAETVGQFAVKSVAVVLGDPYLREGTDLSLVFRAENPALLESVLSNHLARAKLRHPDLTTTRVVVSGEPVTLSSTPDGAIRRYEYAVGDFRVLSNSRGGVGRFIQVGKGKHAKLTEDKGYLGARRLAPYHAKKERAFVFFGDAFVARIVGPQSRILEARRMQAQAELEAVDNLALLYGWLEGRPAKSKGDLLESGWAERSDFSHSDGSSIEWSPEKGARSHWGYAKSLNPIVDLPFDKISKEEAEAYKSFRSWYVAALNGRLDPTSLRVERNEEDRGISTELRVFPVMRSGTFQREFREIAEMVGDGRLEPGAAPQGATVTLGVGAGSPLRNLSDDFIRHSIGGRDLSVNFVGDWVQAGWDEGSVVWDLAGRERETANLEANTQEDSERLQFDELVPRLPLWVALHIKSRLLLAAALTAVRVKVEQTAEGLVKWQKDGPYREVPITQIQARESDSPDAVQANIYYAIAKDVLLISLRREVLKARIDDVLDGRRPKGSRLPQSPTQFVLDLAPSRKGWQRTTAQAWLDRAALSSHELACAGLEVLARGLAGLPEDPSLRRETALRLLGYEPESPQPGGLVWREGLCEHPVYGTPVDPKVPDAKDSSVPLHSVLSAIESLRFALGIVPRGDAAELWARFQLKSAPQPTAH